MPCHIPRSRRARCSSSRASRFASARILPGTQRAYLRLVGFRGGTVPALVLDGRRIQGSRSIARALDQWAPEPALFPPDRVERARVEEAERWGEQELQSVPRILFRWGLVHDMGLRRWFAQDAGFPMPALAARMSGPTARYYARISGADGGTARCALKGLGAMLDRVDALLADGTLNPRTPNAATFQVLSTVRALHAFGDLHELVGIHPAADAAREVFPEYPGPVPRFLPHAWLAASLHPAPPVPSPSPVGGQPDEAQNREGGEHEEARA